jgi:hypothetical protein
MNRTTLLIPALCGNPDKSVVIQALGLVRHHDLEIWEKENIPYTVGKERQAFFDVIESQKAGGT